MSKHPNSLSIRVRLGDEDEPQSLTAQEEVIVLWDRIIAAVLLLALLGGLLFMALHYWRTTEKQPSSAQVSTPQELSPEPVNAEPAVVKDNLSLVAGNHIPAKPETVPATFEEPAVTSDRSVNSTAVGNAEEQGMTVPVAGNVSADAATSSDALVYVHSESILNAHLSTDMKNRIPQNDAPAELTVGSDQLLTVYFAVDIEGYRATPIFFSWYREDRRVARVRVRPKHDLTSTYSSKFIDRHMPGDWRVELTTESGETLAAAGFRVLAAEG